MRKIGKSETEVKSCGKRAQNKNQAKKREFLGGKKNTRQIFETFTRLKERPPILREQREQPISIKQAQTIGKRLNLNFSELQVLKEKVSAVRI